jgi:hypothetical protein
MLVPSARHEGRLAAENAVLGTRRRVAHEIVPTGSFTDPEYASVGLPEAQARERYDCAVAVIGYDHRLRAVIDGHAEGFCKLIVQRRQRYLLGAHVLGEYSAEVIQVAAVAMAANLRVEQLAELQLAFPTFTEALGMAAQQLVRELGVARMPPSLSELELGSLQDGNDKERHACLEVWSVAILPALLVARRGLVWLTGACAACCHPAHPASAATRHLPWRSDWTPSRR